MRGLSAVALLGLFVVGLDALALPTPNYEGYHIVRLSPQHDKHVSFISQLQKKEKLSLLNGIRGVGHHTFVLVPPTKVESLLVTLKTFELPHKVTVSNLSERIKRETLEQNLGTRAYDPTKYNTYDDQVAYINSLAAKNLPQVQEIQVIGQSTEGRDIHAIRLGYKTGKDKKIFLADGGIHAREWISHSVAFHVLDMFTVNAGDYEQGVLNDIDIIIIPNLNPDGYVYSMNTDRMWRKNRRAGSFCKGVDLNRNFPFKYGYSGTSDDPCDETYDGPEASSEPETKTFENFVSPIATQIGGYITFHSYGQLILYPYGYDYDVYPPDVNDLIAAGNAMKTAIANTHGVQYTCENSAGLYPAAGASDDYTKSQGAKYVYTLELRPGDDDWDGFELPAKQIVPTGEEAYNAVKVILELVRKL